MLLKKTQNFIIYLLSEVDLYCERLYIYAYSMIYIPNDFCEYHFNKKIILVKKTYSFNDSLRNKTSHQNHDSKE